MRGRRDLWEPGPNIPVSQNSCGNIPRYLAFAVTVVRLRLSWPLVPWLTAGSGLTCGAARWTADWLTHCFGYHVVHDYLATGSFAWRLMGRGSGSRMVVQEQDGRPPCDW